jgi:tetratricopeptide (TPR) repeat protein
MAQLVPLRLIKANAYFNLGVVYEKEGDLARAIQHYRIGLALSPESRYAPAVRAIIAELEQKLDGRLTDPLTEPPTASRRRAGRR